MYARGFIDVLKIYDGNSSLLEELDAHGAICPDVISDIPSVICTKPNVYMDVRFESGSEDTARRFRLEFISESMLNMSIGSIVLWEVCKVVLFQAVAHSTYNNNNIIIMYLKSNIQQVQ